MAKQDKGVSGQIIIKKYSNRRLYDSTNKRYVTLNDIAALIKDGSEVRVIDSQSGADISKIVLIQVVLESEKNREDILPVSFLHLLIKYGNRVAKDFFENYFLMMFQPYFSVQDNLKNNMHMWKHMGWLPPGVKMPNTGNMDPMGYNNTGKVNPIDIEKFFENQENQQNQQNQQNQEELHEEPQEASTKNVELLLEKIEKLEKKVQSLDEDKLK